MDIIRKYGVAIGTGVAAWGAALSTYAQTLPSSFTVTSQLTFADTYLTNFYTVGTQYAPFIVALVFLLIAVGLVAGVFRRVWGWIAGLGH